MTNKKSTVVKLLKDAPPAQAILGWIIRLSRPSKGKKFKNTFSMLISILI